MAETFANRDIDRSNIPVPIAWGWLILRVGLSVLWGMACIAVVMASGGGGGGGAGGRQSPLGKPRSGESASCRGKLWIHLKDHGTQTAAIPNKRAMKKAPAANLGMELRWGCGVLNHNTLRVNALRFRIAAFQCNG